LIGFFELSSLTIIMRAGFLSVFHSDLEGLINPVHGRSILDCPTSSMGRSVGDQWEINIARNTVNEFAPFRSRD
jgi:hypothetical protein